MPTQQDAQLGFKKETTFKTAVTVDAFPEFTEEDWSTSFTYSESASMRYGRRVQASDRRRITKEEVTGSFTQELLTKGHGKLFEAALGTGVSTVASGAAYQQLFTPAVDDFLPSYTFQKGITLLGGATSPVTFAGCVCSGFELTAGNGELPTIKWNWVGSTTTTATALATASYLSGANILSFVDASLKIGGSVTVPTTTALSSGGTVAANIRDLSLTYDNGLDENGWFLGSGTRGRKPALGVRTITGNITAEYDSNVLRDAYLAQTDMALVMRFQHSTAITGAFYPTIEITIPNIRLNGELPKAAGGDVVTQAIDFVGLDGRVAAHPIYVAVVTAETAI